MMSESKSPRYPLSIAPMMGYTDRHFRFFMRQISALTLLYTEMITSFAVLRGNRPKLLGFSSQEKPLALQLGGDQPDDLAECAKIAGDWDYDEVNLNIGCPSDRVQKGNFGACLMGDPKKVAAVVARMGRATALPVTVKCRIGIDDLDRFEDLRDFVSVVADAGCRKFIIHARKAHLQGLSPKENRNIPPLRYEFVYGIKSEFPGLEIVINGGIRSFEEARGHLTHVDGVMLGRIATERPYLLARADRDFYTSPEPEPSRVQIVRRMLPYIEAEMKRGTPPRQVLRHMAGLFNGRPLARGWRRVVNEIANQRSRESGAVLSSLETAALRIEAWKNEAANSAVLG